MKEWLRNWLGIDYNKYTSKSNAEDLQVFRKVQLQNQNNIRGLQAKIDALENKLKNLMKINRLWH